MNEAQKTSTLTHFQFRLNGIVITHLIVRPVMEDGTTRGWELVACDERIGEFAIDDNQELTDPAQSRFCLEVRDVLIPPSERRFLANKGWKRMNTWECIALLESSGVVEGL